VESGSQRLCTEDSSDDTIFKLKIECEANSKNGDLLYDTWWRDGWENTG